MAGLRHSLGSVWPFVIPGVDSGGTVCTGKLASGFDPVAVAVFGGVDLPV